MGGNVTEQVESTISCNVIAIPYPGRGHINPMMNFCKFIASTQPNILITFIVTDEWHKILSSDHIPATIQFSTIPNVLPSEASRGKIFSIFLEALFTKMEPEVENLLDRIKIPKPSIILADTYLSWALNIGKQRNIPVASFWTTSATMFSIWHHYDLLLQNEHFDVNLFERGEEVVDYIPGVLPICVADLPPQFYGKRLAIVPVTLDVVSSAVLEAKYLLLTSYYELEASVIDMLKAKLSIPIYSIGPSIPHSSVKDNFFQTTSVDGAPDYFEWLNAQPRLSVLYISLGSYLSVSDEQMDEIVAGVLDSGIRFFWVAREGVSRLKEEGGSKGLVMPWCDQLKVLCHPSIGGFWSHCGWNSTKEGAFAGVPVLTFPLKWDQFPNSKHIVEDWNMGWRVRRSEESWVTREEISGVLKRFMDLECDEGKQMRNKAQEIRELCRRATADGGSSQIQIEAFIKDITNIHSHRLH